MAETAGLVLAGGTSLLQAKSTLDQGSIARAQSKAEADVIKTQAAQKEADRKDRLLKVIASQSALAGAGGVAGFQGSPLTVLEENIATAERAQKREDLATRIGVSTVKTRGKIAFKQSRLQAALGLLETAGKMAMSSPGSGGSGGSGGGS